MTLSIRWKVALGMLLGVTLGLAVAGWVLIRSFERLEIARITETLDARSRLVSFSLQPLLVPSLPSTPDQMKALQARVSDLSRHAQARITVIGRDGRVLAESTAPGETVPLLESHATRPEVAQALESGGGTDIRLSKTTGQRMLYLALPLSQTGSPPTAVVRLAVPLTELETRLRDVQRDFFLAFGLAFLISALVSALLTKGLTQPLTDMAAMARRFAEGALDQRIRRTPRDEVGVLANTLNQMADQLDAKIREVSDERAQLLAILTSMVEGVMVLDVKGRVLLLNPALERMFALRDTEARGRPHSEVVRHHELNELVTRVLETRQQLGGEITLGPSGRTLRIEASPVGGQREHEACAVLVFHDVTALRRLEKVRKDFVANVSHELRTPLTSIKGYVEALLDGAKDHPTDAVRFLEIILKQADRLNLILDDLLQLSQIESGDVLFKREPVRLSDLVDRTLASLKPLADKKGHTLTAAVPAELPPLMGDEDRLAQVLTNLVDNAVKYTPERGTITISARHLPAAPGTPADGALELIVADTGVGIPEPDRPRVFERFYRVDKARSRELGGTGLGLAIVKHIVEGHGGRVWVEGNQPVGSRFIVRLPVAQSKE
jgi:two-component system phosphate regulon sensor histidine kinase PhoR